MLFIGHGWSPTTDTTSVSLQSEVTLLTVCCDRQILTFRGRFSLTRGVSLFEDARRFLPISCQPRPSYPTKGGQFGVATVEY